jgi:dienelactone hydrolase
VAARLPIRTRKLLIGLAAFAAFLLLAVAGNSIANYRGWSVPKLEPEALSAKLRPYYRLIHPPGDGPFPTALLFSGCDGPKDNLERWGHMLTEHGWAAMIVDSHGPRGFSEHEIWRLICAGQLFMGPERAGDVLVAIDDARHMRFVDPERMVLIGSSHGAWAVMELLALDPPAALPFNLARLPRDAPPDPLAGVAGVVLLYPYCGKANHAWPDGWRRPMPALFLLSADDFVAPSGNCIEIADSLKLRDLPVEVVTFEGVTHGFDQADRSAVSPLEFDEAATQEALRIGWEFVEGLERPRP